MAEHSVKTAQRIPAAPDEVRDFPANPANQLKSSSNKGIHLSKKLLTSTKDS